MSEVPEENINRYPGPQGVEPDAATGVAGLGVTATVEVEPVGIGEIDRSPNQGRWGNDAGME